MDLIFGSEIKSKINEFSVLESKRAQKTITGIFWNTKDFKKQ